MSDPADGKTDEVLGMSSDVVELLKDEYLHLQKTVEDFDQRTLTIKAWSVTTSMAGIAASFLHRDAAVISLLAALASLSFWMTEALWKEFQQCYYPRIRYLEVAFSAGDTTQRPFQINKIWVQTYRSYQSEEISSGCALAACYVSAYLHYSIRYWNLDRSRTVA